MIDANIMIDMKSTVGVDKLWALLLEMGQRVELGALTFPRQVATELSGVKHPDAPGAWIAHAKNSLRHPQPTEQTMVRVMGVASDVVAADETRDPADPYVLAMTLELMERHPASQVVLVTNDVIDRQPLKISVRTACGRLGLVHCPPKPFMDWLEGEAKELLTDETVVVPEL
ncbi:PIN domain-containing protein [Pseudonocardia oroxyli]|uniref:PIN domain-containing protein n=1 Tax=Pseudonocardia oroxyli TaxID=366584 RepID=UPI00115FF065|nr:PIN domain-containing protein [Pseudonocardia oroxyli]